MKIKSFLAFFAFLLACSACNKQQDLTKVDICTIENPLESIDWLKDIHGVFQFTLPPYKRQIIQYVYKDECVFLIDDCHNCPNGLNIVYDAEQNVICEFGGIAEVNTCPDFETEALESVILGEY